MTQSNYKLTPYQLDKLNILIRSINSDKTIKKWFESLKDLPSNLRTNAIMQITSDMRRNHEDMGIISAVCTLSDTEVYNVVVEALTDKD